MTAAIPLLVLALPAAGTLVLALFGPRWPRRLTQIVGPLAVWASFICVVNLFLNQLQGASPLDQSYWTWIQSGKFEAPFSLLVDHLSVFMGLVITGVGGLIVTYSVGYMANEDDSSYARFFCYMDLFIFSMLLLVLSANFVFLIVGWAMVGLSSYLLIGFWYHRNSAVVAARKAFVMNVIGDIGMILAAFLIFVTYGTVTFGGVFSHLVVRCGGPLGVCGSAGDNPTIEIIAFLLLVGAVAKSAQLPLHTWLPDAMEGPTPVSALIHAATMVTAGVYLVGRMAPIFDVATYAHDAVAIIGTLTALVAATIAIVQTDIKRVLAYSTMSQIGYMFLAVGIGAYASGFFHLMGHAFFKALLFMAAGNVIHALNDEQDMRKYGGLWKDMRATSVMFLVGALSLAGIIPFVGFWTKELILGDTFSRGDPLAITLWLVGFLTALLTGFYTGRMWYLAFWRPASRERPVEHPHEAPPVMLIPVAILALLSTVGGFLQVNAGFHPGWKLIEDWLAPVVGVLGWQARDIEYLPTAATVLLAGFTFFWARSFYVTGTWRPWSRNFPRLQALLEHKYYFDELYDWAFVRPIDRIAAFLNQSFEREVVDGAVDGVGSLTQDTAGDLSLTQSGYFRNYALAMVVGAVLLAIIVVARSA